MPMPAACLEVNCAPPERLEQQGIPRARINSLHRPRQEPLEEKSREREDGFEQVLSTLAQQQSTLEGLMELHKELQGLVQSQHQALEQQLSEVLQGVGASGSMEKPPEEVEEVHDLQEVNAVVSEVQPTRSQASSARRRKHSSQPAVTDKPTAKKEKSEEELKKTRLGAVITSPLFEAAMGGLILVNFAVMFVELQWKGMDNSYKLGVRDNDVGWKEAEQGFKTLNQVFNLIYVLELLVRFYVFRFRLCRNPVNICDIVIIVVSAFNSFFLEMLMDGESSISRLGALVRIIRVLRVIRVLLLLRVLRLMRMMGALRVLLKTLVMSLDSLVWSMAVVGFIIVMSALLMVQLTASFIEDESQSTELRQWTYLYYGSAARASYTMFEATFSAKWATHLARPLIEDINPAFSIFWVLYTVTVNFAVIRVIAALFLKQTMAVAAIDAERVAVEKMREKDNVLTTLRTIFGIGDQQGDGALSKWEFDEMMENPDVLDMFAKLDLEPDELFMLFDLLSEDDGKADQEEFLLGAMKMKNNARTVDMIQVQHQLTVTRKTIEQLRDGIERIDTALHPTDPWMASRRSSKFHGNTR